MTGWCTVRGVTALTDPPVGAVLVQAYRWLDTHGRPQRLSIYAEPVPDARVWAYADDGELVAAVTAEGKFMRRAGADVTYGVDTAAAWNDLIELCRHAHTAHNVWRPDSL